jgi:hypothetical protein
MRAFLPIASRGWLVLFSAGLVGAAAACGDNAFSTDTDAGVVDGGDVVDSTASSSGSSGTSSGGPDSAGPDADNDTGNPADSGSDVPDDVGSLPDVTDPGHDAGPCTDVPTDATGTAVSPDGTGTACTVAQPCATIQQGINAARANSKSLVYVADGTYTEVLTLPTAA